MDQVQNMELSKDQIIQELIALLNQNPADLTPSGSLISSGIALHSGQHSSLSQSLFVSPSKDWKTTVGGPVRGDFCVKSNLHTSFGDDSATRHFS